MAIKYRLGLDLGTNSLGWALWKLNKQTPAEIMDAGVRIFPDGRDGTRLSAPGDPLALQRRDARGLRRRRKRFLQRKRALVRILIRDGLWPDDPQQRLEYSHWDPYTLRAQALRHELTPPELGRLLLHLSQRRGFRSRRNMADNACLEEHERKIAALNAELDYGNFRTLGEFLNTRKKQGSRFRENSDFYPDRQHYIQEFQAVRERQQQYFPNLSWDEISEILFMQRPLKPQKKGMCRYYTDQERAYRALPSTQRFRILQELSNLRMTGPEGETVRLTRAERDNLYQQLEQREFLDFDDMRGILGTGCRFNLENGKRDGLTGNETGWMMRQFKAFGAVWDELDYNAQDEIVQRIAETGDEEEIRRILKPFELSELQTEYILKMNLVKGVARYSAALHRECVRIMENDYCSYTEAMKKLGFNYKMAEGRGEEDKLHYYGKIMPESCIIRKDPDQNADEARYGKIGNPTVHIALNELRKVVNALIAKYGKPEEIVLELSRELKLGRQEIFEYAGKREKYQRLKNELDRELNDSFSISAPEPEDREKLLCYHELQKNSDGALCPYCGKVILYQDLFTPSVVVRHILPYSRTMDDSQSNKIVVHQSCSQKKQERSPWEAFGNNADGFNWNSIQFRIRNLPRTKRWRFDQDAMESYEHEETGFIQRQLSDNAYISRIARRYLTSICPPGKIWTVKGRHTAILRRCWQLNLILSVDADHKNRSDYRHHAVDAAVIGLTDRTLIRQIASANRLEDGDGQNFQIQVPEFPGGQQGRDKLFKQIRNIMPSIRPEHDLQGRFFKDTAYGLIKKSLPAETARIKKYMVDDIVPDSLRQEFKKTAAEMGFYKARKKMREQYPEIRIFQTLWVRSKPLTRLDPSDLLTPTYDLNTKGLSDFKLRNELAAFTGQHPRKRFENIMKLYSEKHGIRNVRCIAKNQQMIPVGNPVYKGYEADDYVYVDVWQLPVKPGQVIRYKGIFVSRQEACRIKLGQAENRRPHPAAKKLIRLFKKDIISIQENGEWNYYQISGFSLKQGKFDIRPIYSAVNKGWSEQTSPESIKGSYPPISGQNYKSINSLWQKHRVRKITVHCDGSVR